jgi:uncharacterized protein (DUF697 family)/GTPase Era involved in 16S rRNA processing
MAIDPEKYGKFRDSIDEFIKSIPGEGAENQSRKIIENHIDPLLDEYDDILSGERPPRLYIFGRSGAGKSSLINALSNKDVASVGAVEPETLESELYNISFPEMYSDWEVVDSRGLFESVTPDGELSDGTIEFMKDDIEEYRPDVLLHVMTPDQVRAGEDDFKVVSDLEEELENVPPILTILNKVDVHMSPGGDWPPEDNPELSGQIQRNLEFLSEVISDVVLENDFNVESFDKSNPVRGQQFDSKKFIGVIPVFAKSEPHWNIDTLSLLIGYHLPDDARLQFFQAQERASIMRDLASDITRTSSSVAATIGGAPTSYADIVPLTALQYVQIVLIGGLSCRELELKTATEFISSLGFISGSALGLRELARGLIQFMPGAGQAISASVAGGGTYAMGKAAERYFFDGVVKEPDALIDEGEALFEDYENSE